MGLIESLMCIALIIIVAGVEWELSRAGDFNDRLDDYNDNPR